MKWCAMVTVDQSKLLRIMTNAIWEFSCHQITERHFRAEIKRYNAFTNGAPVDADEIVSAVKRFIKP